MYTPDFGGFTLLWVLKPVASSKNSEQKDEIKTVIGSKSLFALNNT